MDHRAAIGGGELEGLDAGEEVGPATQGREAGGEVAVRAVVEVFAERVAADPVGAMARGSRPGPSLLVGLVLDRGLQRLPAQPFLGIDEVLPDNRWRMRMLAEADLQVGILRADVDAAGFAHPGSDRLQVVYAARDLAERIVGLAVRGQVELGGMRCRHGSVRKA